MKKAFIFFSLLFFSHVTFTQQENNFAEPCTQAALVAINFYLLHQDAQLHAIDPEKYKVKSHLVPVCSQCALQATAQKQYIFAAGFTMLAYENLQLRKKEVQRAWAL